eukprot:COSAG05_NODE_2002_length_3720_cov_11.469207_3_plen_74_part_00
MYIPSPQSKRSVPGFSHASMRALEYILKTVKLMQKDDFNPSTRQGCSEEDEEDEEDEEERGQCLAWRRRRRYP